ncbi:MAG: glycosyltransferase family 4 protein [Anaerolineales bacterium]
MNICFIEDTMLHGGTQLWVVDTVRAYHDQGDMVTLLAPQQSWVHEQCQGSGVNTPTYPFMRPETNQDVLKETWMGALEGCDVAICTVHPPRDNFHCMVFAARCIKEAGLHTHLIAKTGTIVPSYMREYYLPDGDISSSVIAISAATLRYLVGEYGLPEKKVALIYQGVDSKRFRSSERLRAESLRRYSLKEIAAPVIGCIGSFEERKGQSILLETMVELRDGLLPDAQLLLFGNGPKKENIIDLIDQMDLGPVVTIHPFTSEPEYALGRLDLLVLPSLGLEGLPNVLQESLSMGIPVIGTDVGGVSEVVEDGVTGYVVSPGDPTALAGAIQRMWVDKRVYAEMQSNGVKLVMKKFDRGTQLKILRQHLSGYAMRAPEDSSVAGTHAINEPQRG